MPQKLYVDKFQFIDGTFSPVQVTNSMETIRYNCNTVNTLYLGTVSEELLDGDNVTLTFPAGRFICIVAIYLSQHLFNMTIIDLHNNNDWFHKTLEGLQREHPEIREQIIIAWNGVKENYESGQDLAFELAEGAPPTTAN